MDSGATSHMTHNPGTLMSLFNLSTNNHILVGNYDRIPITSYGHTSLSPHKLSLCDVLKPLKLSKNLISLKKIHI